MKGQQAYRLQHWRRRLGVLSCTLSECLNPKHQEEAWKSPALERLSLWLFLDLPLHAYPYDVDHPRQPLNEDPEAVQALYISSQEASDAA